MANEVGSLYRSALAVTDANGAPMDAGTSVLTVTLPDGTIATPAVNHDGVGLYHVDYLFTQEGLHQFHWVTTAPNTTKSDYVNASIFRSMVGLDETKAYINFGTSSNEDILRQIMQAATELCENIVGSCVPRTLSRVLLPGNTKESIRLPMGPLPTESSVSLIVSTWPNGPSWSQAKGDFDVSPESGVVYLANQTPFYLGPWKGTYTVGRLVIPQSIQLAAKEIIFDMWSTQRPYGLGEMEPGPEATARFEQMISTYSIPPHAQVLLSHYEMPGFA